MSLDELVVEAADRRVDLVVVDVRIAEAHRGECDDVVEPQLVEAFIEQKCSP